MQLHVAWLNVHLGLWARSLLGGVGDIGTHWSNIRVILGLYEENGKENGNYYNGVIQGLGLRVQV